MKSRMVRRGVFERTVLLMLFLAGMVSAATRPRSTHAPDGFKQAGEMLMQSMNLSADPCEDFYTYACGGWMASHPIPPEKKGVSPFTVVADLVLDQKRIALESSSDPSRSNAKRMVRAMYRACLDEEALEVNRGEDIVKGIKSVGSWPMIGNDWRLSDFDLTNLLIEGSLRDASAFVEVGMGLHPDNNTVRIINIDSHELIMTRDYYLNLTKYNKLVTAYKDYLFAKASIIAEDAGNHVSPDALKSDIEEIFHLEQKMANIIVPREDRRNITEFTHIRKISDLQKLFPIVDWQRYFKSTAPFEVHAYLASSPDIDIADLNYMGKLSDILSKTDPRIITNYVILRYTKSFGALFDSRYMALYQKFAAVLYGTEKKEERWKQCTAVVSSKMSYVTGALWVGNNFKPVAKDRTLEMIEELVSSFNDLLHQSTWMDERTKKEALSKLAQIDRQVGYPEWILDDAKLDDYYTALDIQSSDSFSNMLNKVYRWANDVSYKKLLEPMDRREFTTNPSTVNAYYSGGRNAIIFPGGILQPPFFQEAYPMSLNFGAIGSIIGHELTHGFDDSGRQLDGVGNLKDWWDELTKKEFNTRSQCFVDQYSAIYVEAAELHLNGKLELGENIADNGGVKQAHMAYKKFIKKHGEEPNIPMIAHLSNEQLFFIGWAQSWCKNLRPATLQNLILSDEHAPGKFRVEVVLGNQPEFAQVYKCPEGSLMNPEKRCAVW